MYLVNSSVTESIMSSDKAFLVAGLARVIVSTPSSLVTLVKDAIPLQHMGGEPARVALAVGLPPLLAAVGLIDLD